MKEKIKDLIVVLVMFFLLVGCSPAQRIARIIERNPQLAERQTIIARDTLVFPGLNFDKPLIIRDRETVRDTVGKTVFEYIREVDTIYVRVQSEPDTTFIEIPVEVEVMKVYKTKKWDPPLWLRILGLFFVFGVAGLFFKWLGYRLDSNYKQNGNV